MPTDVAEPDREPDPNYDEDIFAFDTFRDLGCDILVAMALAHNDVSPSALRELVAHGCPLDRAIQILL